MTLISAGTGRVEKARLDIDWALTSGYQRTGQGWTARRADGITAWTPLSSRELAAS